MEISMVKDTVEKNYDIEISKIEKIKNVYKIDSNKGRVCLKLIKYNYKHFLFIISAMMHLRKNGFTNVLPFITTIKGKYYIEIENNYAYLNPWIESRQCNYNNPLDVILATSTLAKLHKKSEGFTITEDMQPRIGWFKWIETFKTRINEVLDFKQRIEAKDEKTEFDNLYMNMMKEELYIARKSVDDLLCTDYLEKMKEEINKKGFCHHDYAHHNVLVNNNSEVTIIDFDYCILDTHLHDLASLLIRKMKNGKWDIDSANFILDVYNSVKKVDKLDISIMAAFIEFPQDYWQVGIQYYWEKQPWTEEFFMSKLNKILKDREQKQEFVDEFMSYRYNS